MIDCVTFSVNYVWILSVFLPTTAAHHHIGRLPFRRCDGGALVAYHPQQFGITACCERVLALFTPRAFVAVETAFLTVSAVKFAVTAIKFPFITVETALLTVTAIKFAICAALRSVGPFRLVSTAIRLSVEAAFATVGIIAVAVSERAVVASLVLFTSESLAAGIVAPLAVRQAARCLALAHRLFFIPSVADRASGAAE